MDLELSLGRNQPRKVLMVEERVAAAVVGQLEEMDGTKRQA